MRSSSTRNNGGRYYDGRHGHNHYYPQRGVYVGSVPRGYRVLPYGGVNYYYARGVWYRPYGARFIVVGPPIGVVVPILPPYYATIWWGGVPYYYANDVYYSQAPENMVVNPPPGVVSQSPPPGAVPPSPRRPKRCSSTHARSDRAAESNRSVCLPPLGRGPDRLRPDPSTWRCGGSRAKS